VTEHLVMAPMTARDELHELIDEIEDQLAKPGLHATIDALPDELIPTVFNRIRALQAGTTVHPPQFE
jgi:hypothetical protein